ncbi:MAG: desaturase, partial [Gammaproteobacteria bacterium]
AEVAGQLVSDAAADMPSGPGSSMRVWADEALGLPQTAIATVYARAPGARLSAPMLALRPAPAGPGFSAQFVFDRGQLQPDDPAMQGVLAFVVSASTNDRATLEAAVLAQGRQQLGLDRLAPIRTVVERRATFACIPGLVRPPAQIADGLTAAADYVDGPYPATIEGAVRSGQHAASLLSSDHRLP